MSNPPKNKQKQAARHEVRLALLLEKGLAGDARSYQKFLSETSLILRKYFAKRGLATDDAEDLLQEVLISIHKARHTYDADRPLLPWVFAITRFRFADFWRKRYQDKPLQQAFDVHEMQDQLAEPVTESASLPEELDEALAKLPEKKRRILYLLHYEGCTAKETAQRLGMKESAVKVAAHRIYQQFRLQLNVKEDKQA